MAGIFRKLQVCFIGETVANGHELNVNRCTIKNVYIQYNRLGTTELMMGTNQRPMWIGWKRHPLRKAFSSTDDAWFFLRYSYARALQLASFACATTSLIWNRVIFITPTLQNINDSLARLNTPINFNRNCSFRMVIYITTYNIFLKVI